MIIPDVIAWTKIYVCELREQTWWKHKVPLFVTYRLCAKLGKIHILQFYFFKL